MHKLIYSYSLIYLYKIIINCFNLYLTEINKELPLDSMVLANFRTFDSKLQKKLKQQILLNIQHIHFETIYNWMITNKIAYTFMTDKIWNDLKMELIRVVKWVSSLVLYIKVRTIAYEWWNRVGNGRNTFI